jgi:hypothetical protein
MLAVLLLSSTGDALVLRPTKHRAATALRASSSTSTWQTLRDLRQRALETVIGPEPDLPDAVEVAGLVAAATAACGAAYGVLQPPLPAALAPRAAAVYGAAAAPTALGGALSLVPACRRVGRAVGRRTLARAAAWPPLAVTFGPVLAVLWVDKRLSKVVFGDGDSGMDLDGGTLLGRLAFGAAIPLLLAWGIGYAAFCFVTGRDPRDDLPPET